VGYFLPRLALHEYNLAQLLFWRRSPGALEMQASPTRPAGAGDAETENLPLLGGGGSLASSIPNSSSAGALTGSSKAAGGGAGMGIGQAQSSPAFFSENSFLRILFLRSSVGHKMRARVTLGWGLFSIALGFAVLRMYYEYSPARSFCLAATTLTTIGYSVSEKDSTSATADYPFLSVYFLFFVLPFSFFQSVTYIDATYAASIQLNTRIAARCRRGYVAASAFVTEFWATLAVTTVLIFVLLFLGTLCYSYFGKLTTWRKGVFYAITSATTIGYGSFEVQDEYGYYAVGVYALACNYVVSIVFPSLAAFFVVAAENVERISKIRREEESQNKFRRDVDSAIM